MKLTIDTNGKTIQFHENGEARNIDLYSKEAFEVISHLWLKVGWNEKYSYTFSWMGLPIIQLPEDMVRAQEVIYKVKPDVIIETGVAHGGSLIFYASLFNSMGRGRVIGIDIDIHLSNRKSIESHDLASYITLIEGDSISPKIVSEVASQIGRDQRVMVLLDSNHTYNHVLAELEAYHGFVSPGSYIVATDGVMKDLIDVPRGNLKWATDNPAHAAVEFAHTHKDFILEQPDWFFNESILEQNITYWPKGYLKRIR